MQPKIIDSRDNDGSLSVVSSADNGSALELVKMKFVRQSLKRGLADLESGRVQDGDSVFDSMINAGNK